MLIRNESFLNCSVTMNFIHDDPENNSTVQFSIGDVVKVYYNDIHKRVNKKCIGKIIDIDISRVKHCKNHDMAHCGWKFHVPSNDEILLTIDVSKEYIGEKIKVFTKDIISLEIYEKENTQVVKKQAELDLALEDPNVEIVNIRTFNERSFNIPDKEYDKILFVEAPNSTIINKGVFKYIQINHDSVDSVGSIGFVEKATGNIINITAANYTSIKIANEAMVKKIHAIAKVVDINSFGYVQTIEITESVDGLEYDGKHKTSVNILSTSSTLNKPILIKNSSEFDMKVYINSKEEGILDPRKSCTFGEMLPPGPDDEPEIPFPGEGEDDEDPDDPKGDGDNDDQTSEDPSKEDPKDKGDENGDGGDNDGDDQKTDHEDDGDDGGDDDNEDGPDPTNPPKTDSNPDEEEEKKDNEATIEEVD